MMQAAVGDLLCGDVDIDRFQAACRAPLFPDQWNRWILARSDFDTPSPLSIKRQVPAVLSKWFEDVSEEGGVVRPGKPGFGPSIDNVRFRILTKAEARSMGHLTSASTNDGCPPIFLRSGGVVWVLVEFIPRSAAASLTMPWPVHKAQVWNPWCPEGADWILETILHPLTPAQRSVPKEESVTEQLGNQAAQAAAAARSALPTISPITIGGLGLLGLAAVFVFARGVR